MKIINKLGVPDEIFQWLSQDFYDHEGARGTISATTLLKPTQQVVLEKRHEDQIEVEAVDRIWSLFGSGVHAVLAKVKDDNAVPVERLRVDFEGVTVSGEFDRIANNRVVDYKVTSAWTAVFGSRDEDWKLQLSIYRYLYYKTKGVLLDDVGSIVAIFRDWAAKNIKPDDCWKKVGDYYVYEGSKGYPPLPIMKFDIQLHSIEFIDDFIKIRLKSIREAMDLPDSEQPTCSDSQRWFNKKTGTYQKCAKYCGARAFCHQAAKQLFP